MLRGSSILKAMMFVLVVIARLTLRLGWGAAVDGSTRLSKVQGVNTSYAIPGLPNLPNLPDVDVPNVPDVDVPNRNDRNRNDRSGDGPRPGVPNPNGPNPNECNDGNDSRGEDYRKPLAPSHSSQRLCYCRLQERGRS